MNNSVIKNLALALYKTHNVELDYEFDKELGTGAYGTVYLAHNRSTRERRAIKVIKRDTVEDAETFKNEINILMNLDHASIIKLYDVYESNDFIYLITDCCEGGELFHYITKTKHLTENEAAQIMRQIFSALNYCHKNNICHRDIKPENF